MNKCFSKILVRRDFGENFFTWLYNFQEQRWKHVNKQWFVTGFNPLALLTCHSRLDAQILCWERLGKRPKCWNFFLVGRNFFLLSKCCSSQWSQTTCDNLVSCTQVVSSFWCDVNHSAIGRLLDNLIKRQNRNYFFRWFRGAQERFTKGRTTICW